MEVTGEAKINGASPATNNDSSQNTRKKAASRAATKNAASKPQKEANKETKHSDKETTNDEGYFAIEIKKNKDILSHNSEYEIQFNLNDKRESATADIPDNIISFYEECKEVYCVIKAMPIILKPVKRYKIKQFKYEKEHNKKPEDSDETEQYSCNDELRDSAQEDSGHEQSYKKLKKEYKKAVEIEIRNKYIQGLCKIARDGLQGKAPQPKLAKKLLNKMKEELLIKEGGKIKNRHFVDLGIKALVIGLFAAALGCVLMQFSKGAVGLFEYFRNNNIYPYLFIFAGSMAGTWVSFGVRNLDMTFRDLAVIEEDMLNSTPRLFFVGVVSIIFVFFLNSSIITFDISGIKMADIMENIELQLLVGVIAGLLGNKLATGLYGRAKSVIRFGEEK